MSIKVFEKDGKKFLEFPIDFNISKNFVQSEEIEKKDQGAPDDRYTAKSGDRIVEGYASTSALDRQNHMILGSALKKSVKELLEEARTMLRNHDLDDEIGVLLSAKYVKEDEALWIQGRISSDRDDIWKKVQEGVLSSFSIRAQVIDWEDFYDEDRGRYIFIIKEIKLIEISLVTVPANPKAKVMDYYVKKAFEEYALNHCDKKAKSFCLQLFDEGVPDMKVNKENQEIVKSNDVSNPIVQDDTKKDNGTSEVASSDNKSDRPSAEGITANDKQGDESSKGESAKVDDVNQADDGKVADKVVQEPVKDVQLEIADQTANQVSKSVNESASTVNNELSEDDKRIADLEKAMSETSNLDLKKSYENTINSLKQLNETKKKIEQQEREKPASVEKVVSIEKKLDDITSYISKTNDANQLLLKSLKDEVSELMKAVKDAIGELKSIKDESVTLKKEVSDSLKSMETSIAAAKSLDGQEGIGPQVKTEEKTSFAPFLKPKNYGNR